MKKKKKKSSYNKMFGRMKREAKGSIKGGKRKDYYES